ncbi:MAG: Maf family nucleotide pyrophosphatase [Cytophagales bacterium]|nr:Maf family nucleotide pyrophosphatase [Cytophagales bacterium]
MSSIPRLILASNSPRRKQLLSELGYEFTVRTCPVDEDFPDDMPAGEVAEFLARKKNKANRAIASENEVAITADTVVIRGQDILNKPADAQEAYDMIKSLSGRSHEVVTGVCISDSEQSKSFSVKTVVHFAELTDDEIHHYINVARPFDKAGAYGIQEWIGMIGVTRIEGSYSNVVGLPTREVYEGLRDFMP